MSSPNRATVVSYVSSPHKGYLEFFRKYEGGTLYVLGSDLISDFPSLVRHLPGNTPEELQSMIQSLGIFADIQILERGMIEQLQHMSEIVMPDEDVSRAIAEKYFNDTHVIFDNSWRLRWDWNSSSHQRRPEGEQIISIDEFNREMMQLGFDVANQSSDWWRQVAALLVRDGELLLTAFNQHLPSEQSPYLYGDPRSNFGPGQRIDVSTALHAEIGIIAEAARRGIATEGCDLYVTTFPCPPCAYACSKLGLKRLFYADGYSLLEGAAAFSKSGTQIVRVDMGPPPST